MERICSPDSVPIHLEHPNIEAYPDEETYPSHLKTTKSLYVLSYRQGLKSVKS